MEKNTHQLIKNLWKFISKKRKIQILLLLLLMIASSVSEIFTIASLFPFIGLLTYPEAFYNKPAMQPFILLIGASDSKSLILPLTIIFSTAAIISCLLRLAVLKFSTKTGFEIGSDIGIEVYERTLHQPYIVHISRNSGEIISAITTKTNILTNNVIVPLLNLFTNSLVLTSVFLTLVYINPTITISTFLIYLFAYLYILKLTKNQKKLNGQIIAGGLSKIVKLLQEGLGGVRDIILENKQNYYASLFAKADRQLRNAQAANQFIATAPRYIMECVGMLLVAALAFLIALWPKELPELIPLLAVLGVGAQRMLPAMQQIYVAWFSVVSNHVSVKDIISLLEQPLMPLELSSSEQLKFNQVIQLENISFCYENELPLAIKKINLMIERGSKIGFVGRSGSGKSTLLDIIMGLINPTEGTLKVDGLPISPKNVHLWYKHIAHVPQEIFLADASISENIAFGVDTEEIDQSRLFLAAKFSGIAEYIDSLPGGYDTIVGERGVKLSGGQKQRIGIARALYKKAKVIVLDEATSALDSNTEESVMSSIDLLDSEITVLMVAHRISTLSNCDYIIELDNGIIKRVCKYSDISNIG